MITLGPWNTKGPKRVDDANDYAIIDTAGNIIGEAFGRCSKTLFLPSEHNAAVMALAPEMLDLLIEIEKHVKGGCTPVAGGYELRVKLLSILRQAALNYPPAAAVVGTIAL